MARLASDIWVAAYLARLQQAMIPVYVTRRGDATAGAILIKQTPMDGTARAFQRSFDLMTGQRHWMVLAEGPEAEVDAALSRAAEVDPDLWILEVEDRQGRHLLDQEGLRD